MDANCHANDPFSARLRNRLKTTVMGLGLARLLLDAGRTEDARTTLQCLEDGVAAAAPSSAKRMRKYFKARRARSARKVPACVPQARMAYNVATVGLTE